MDNINTINTGAYFYNDEAFNFEFVTSISASEKILFVNSVVDTIVGDNYNSIIKDMIFDYTLIKVFTDIDTSFIDNSKDIINTIEQFLSETNIVDVVKVNMEYGLLEELNNATDKAIEYRTGIHSSPLNDALARLISTLEKKVDEFDMGSMMDMAQKFVSMTDEFSLDSIVNAYMNSDIHKNNVVEIEEAKRNKMAIAENLDKAIKAVKDEMTSKNDTGKKSKKSKT